MLYYYQIRRKPRVIARRWFAATCALLVTWGLLYLGPAELMFPHLGTDTQTPVTVPPGVPPNKPVERSRATQGHVHYEISVEQAEAVAQELSDTGKKTEAEELRYSLSFLNELGDNAARQTRTRTIKRDIANTVTYFKAGNTASNKVQILGNYDGGSLAFVYYPHYGVHFNPVTTANTAIRQYGAGNYDAVVKTADELLSYVIVDQYPGVGTYYIWEYYFDFEFHGLTYPAPWASGMAQGLILDVLGKAYKITGKQKYLDAGKMVLNSFRVPWEEGGVVQSDQYGNWYLEVAATNKLRILNGFLFTLNSIHNYYQETGDEEARLLFASGIDEAKAHLNEYDTGYWSKYSLLDGDLADYKYHELHIVALSKLYSITRIPEFDAYAKRFDFYLKNRFIDIPPTHRSFKAISTLTEQGIISSTNGWFSGNSEIKKSEFIRWLVRALRWGPATVYKGYYPDIRRDFEDWGYIEAAFENGIRLAGGDGSFRPDDGISRSEMESILQQALSKANPIEYDSSHPQPDKVTKEQAANRLYELLASK